MDNFPDPLHLKYIDGRRWLVTASFRYHLGSKAGDEFVRVDAGTLTDFASIPRPLKMLWPSPGSSVDRPAVCHDELYVLPFIQHVDGTARRIDRAEADRIFFEAMGVTKTPGLTRRLLWLGVRSGGWVPWRRYRKAEQVNTVA